jgi:hypothetical protein
MAVGCAESTSVAGMGSWCSTVMSSNESSDIEAVLGVVGVVGADDRFSATLLVIIAAARRIY